MLFYEPLFLFVFLPVVFAATWRWRQVPRARMGVLLVASLVFYTWGEPGFVPVVLASSWLDHVLAGLVARRIRWALIASVGLNLALLVAYKYTGFLYGNLADLVGLFGAALPAAPVIALPIGVSFIVFEKITYVVDIWRGLSQPARRFLDYLTYVLFFPKLLAGPIIKYHEIDQQFRAPPPLDHDRLYDGFARFMLGVTKKLLIADIVGPAADAAFAIPPDQLGFGAAWAGVMLFTLQIYFDFSAYSDMAIGLARIFGFALNENFNRPYISCSVTEFWRRWHISLTSWIREYLYIPLGGNRVPPARRLANLWICFLASGAWHGAAWTYVLWGAYNGVFLILDRLFLLSLLDRLPRWLANALTMLAVMVGWTIFRATSLAQLGAFGYAMVHPALTGTGLMWKNTVLAATGAGLLASFAPRLPQFETAAARLLSRRETRFCVEAGGTMLFAIAVSKAVADPFRPFLYFRF